MNNKLNKSFIIITLLITLGTSLAISYGPIKANGTATPAKPATTQEKVVTAPVSTAPAIDAAPLQIVADPAKYLNKNVKFKATFDKFSALGLDYKPAMKSSQDYIGILIKRDDVKDHTVPLSELKMFLDRKSAEKFIDIDAGDIVEIEGNVFSTALGDPWIDIKKFTIITQAKKKEETTKKQ